MTTKQEAPPYRRNGNGNGGTGWAAAAICSTIALTIAGAFSSAYVRDQNRIETRLTTLEGERAALAERRGEVAQTLEQLAEGVGRNRERIEAAFRELDDKLQREMRLLDDTARADLNALDGRLQSEITRNSGERHEALSVLRDEITRLRHEQERFEDQLGVKRAVAKP